MRDLPWPREQLDTLSPQRNARAARESDRLERVQRVVNDFEALDDRIQRATLAADVLPLIKRALSS